MDKISLHYSENIISRKKGRAEQILSFFMVVENLDYNKQVEVNWCGEDGNWHSLAASFHSKLDAEREYWAATVVSHASAGQSLPGNIEFNLCYQSKGSFYWDNNNGDNYLSEADSGVRLCARSGLQAIHFSRDFAPKQKFVPITVAVSNQLFARAVTVHWTVDNWRHTQTAACHYQRRYWDKKHHSNARNPNQYGVAIWKTWLRVADAFRLEYSICCESDSQTTWDNNFGYNYAITRKPLQLMILNLHCRQEPQQDEKLSLIAQAITDHQVDVVCFQEVAEEWNKGMGDWQSNTAKIINDRLPEPFHIYADWSHLGFERYREGLAILSRYPVLHESALYVSDSQDPYSIDARKVLMTEIEVPYMGRVNIYSAHLSWWENGFAKQFKRLHEWAQNNHQPATLATLLCGDFNVAADSQGYQLVMGLNCYEDAYLNAKAGQGGQSSADNEYRIDYVFVHHLSQVQAVHAHALFTENDYGKVSDHSGYVMTFEPK